MPKVYNIIQNVSRPDRILQPGSVYMLILFKDLHLLFSGNKDMSPDWCGILLGSKAEQKI